MTPQNPRDTPRTNLGESLAILEGSNYSTTSTGGRDSKPHDCHAPLSSVNNMTLERPSMSDRHVRKLLKAVEAVRHVDHTMNTQTLSAFLNIALYEGENINSIANKTDMAQSAASRNVSSLTAWDWRKKPGLKLVEYREDPMNLSHKPLYLTAKGKHLLDKLVAIMEEH